LTKTATLSFSKVVWRRYLGEVGKFYRTQWLIYPGHCISISVKIGKFFFGVWSDFNKLKTPDQSTVEVMTKKFWCVFYASQCIAYM